MLRVPELLISIPNNICYKSLQLKILRSYEKIHQHAHYQDRNVTNIFEYFEASMNYFSLAFLFI